MTIQPPVLVMLGGTAITIMPTLSVSLYGKRE
jgi:hypothetical protein